MFCCAFFPPLQWSPLILNPSYTILHFLGATKVVSQHGVWFWRARFYQWSWQHALTSLHRPAYHFETCVCCFKAAQVHNSLFTVETLPTTLSYLLWAGNSWASLVVKMGGCLPPKVRLMRHAWHSANVCVLPFSRFEYSVAVKFRFLSIFHAAIT